MRRGVSAVAVLPMVLFALALESGATLPGATQNLLANGEFDTEVACCRVCRRIRF